MLFLFYLRFITGFIFLRETSKLVARVSWSSRRVLQSFWSIRSFFGRMSDFKYEVWTQSPKRMI
jgi:hypothetical protein